MMGTYKAVVQKRTNALVHGKGVNLVIPNLPCEENLDPVDNWSTINLSSVVNDGASQGDPCLGRREVAFQEDHHIGDRKVNSFSEENGFNVHFIHSERPQHVHTGVCN